MLARAVVASILGGLFITHASVHMQFPPSADAVGEAPLIFSLNASLDGADDPVRLGIRDGQTVVQAAESFCEEHRFDDNVRSRIMPELIKILEDGIAEAMGRGAAAQQSEPVRDSGPTNTSTSTERGRVAEAALGDPLLTLGVSLDGGESQTMNYYASQDSAAVAAEFCANNLAPLSPPDALTRCSKSLSDSIRERLHGTAMPSPENAAAHQADRTRDEPWLTVPLNVNGQNTTLVISKSSEPSSLAQELCRRLELGLQGPALDSCFLQVERIAVNAISAYTSRHSGPVSEPKEAKPFTFKVPVTLAGLELHAEFKTSETPRQSALRFCRPHLLAIESALGLRAPDSAGVDDEEALANEDEAEGRQTLVEACTVVVEDAINAVLLGLRERVMEAEMALDNATRGASSTSAESLRLLNQGSVARGGGQIPDDTVPG